MIAKEALQWHF